MFYIYQKIVDIDRPRVWFVDQSHFQYQEIVPISFCVIEFVPGRTTECGH